MATEQMFCFQCEQVAKCEACTGGAGVCGKPADVADAQDALTGAMIALARTAREAGVKNDRICDLIVDGLFTCMTNVNFDGQAVTALKDAVRVETVAVAAAAGIEPVSDYDVDQIWGDDEDIRSLKSLVLFGLRGTAAYAYHARVLGYRDATVDEFFADALAQLAEPGSVDALLPLALKVGEVNLGCMRLLDEANTGTYGTPEPTTVAMEVEPGPFISGHDLHDLKLLLEQTEGTGVSIYTHGEMLPAHAYPELKKYPQLKGNFGTAWQNQKKEFDGVPAAFLFTTNCLMPPKESYADNVFTTEVVAFPGCTHIGPDKDFGPVIQKALELDPNDIMAQFFYARLLDGSGDKASAHKYYQQVLRRLPQDAEVHYYYGRSLGEAGKVFDAYLHLAYSSLYQNDKRKTESWLKQARPLARTPVEQDQLKRFEAIYAERQEVWK